MTKTYKSPPGGEIDYGRVIKDNLALVRRHRFLWFFGLFAGTTSAIGGWSCDYNSYVTVPGQDETVSAGEIVDTIGSWIQNHLGLIITIVIIGVVVSVLVWLWSVFCHGAVVATVRDINLGREVSFATALTQGKRNFRRLLPYMLLIVLLPVLLSLMILVLGAAAYIVITSSNDAAVMIGGLLLGLAGLIVASAMISTLGLLAFLGLAPVLAVATFLLFNLGSRAVVLDGLRPVAALKNAGRLLCDNLASSAMLFIISVGIGIGCTIVMIFAALLASIPTLLAWVVTYQAGWPLGGIIIASLLSLPPLIVGLLFTAGLNTYFAAYWTDVRMLFSGAKQQSREHQADRDLLY